MMRMFSNSKSVPRLNKCLAAVIVLGIVAAAGIYLWWPRLEWRIECSNASSAVTFLNGGRIGRVPVVVTRTAITEIVPAQSDPLTMDKDVFGTALTWGRERRAGLMFEVPDDERERFVLIHTPGRDYARISEVRFNSDRTEAIVTLMERSQSGLDVTLARDLTRSESSTRSRLVVTATNLSDYEVRALEPTIGLYSSDPGSPWNPRLVSSVNVPSDWCIFMPGESKSIVIDGDSASESAGTTIVFVTFRRVTQSGNEEPPTSVYSNTVVIERK